MPTLMFINTFESDDVYLCIKLQHNLNFDKYKLHRNCGNRTTIFVHNTIIYYYYIIDGIKTIDYGAPYYITEDGMIINYLNIYNYKMWCALKTIHLAYTLIGIFKLCGCNTSYYNPNCNLCINKSYYTNNFIPYIKTHKNNKNVLYILGFYYATNKLYDKMEKYYLLADIKGHTDALMMLALEHPQSVKYYEMAIEKYKNTNAMTKLAYIYKSKNNYDLMVKYFEMALKNGDRTGLSELARYHEYKKNYYYMIKYKLQMYNMANSVRDIQDYYYNVEHNSEKAYKLCIQSDSLYIFTYENFDTYYLRLAKHYFNKENYEAMKSAYIKLINNKSFEGMIEFASYYKDIKYNYDKANKYYKMAIETLEKHYGYELQSIYLHTIFECYIKTNDIYYAKKYCFKGIKLNNSNNPSNITYETDYKFKSFLKKYYTETEYNYEIGETIHVIDY